jgi:FkbM family methyltransferase
LLALRIDGPLLHRLLHSYTTAGFRGASKLWNRCDRIIPLPATSQLHIGSYAVPLMPGTDVIDAHLYRGTYEVPELALVPRYISQGATVVDVGANGGLYSALALSRGATRVIAVEPNPALAERLRLIEGLDVREVAVSSCPGEATLHMFRDSSYYSSIRDYDIEGTEPILVKVAPLDSLLCDVPQIDFLKIDVEYSEAGVLAGASNMFSERRVRMALIEVLVDHEWIAGYLAERGYSSNLFGMTMGRFWRRPTTLPIAVSSGQAGNYLVSPIV